MYTNQLQLFKYFQHIAWFLLLLHHSSRIWQSLSLLIPINWTEQWGINVQTLIKNKPHLYCCTLNTLDCAGTRDATEHSCCATMVHQYNSLWAKFDIHKGSEAAPAVWDWLLIWARFPFRVATRDARQLSWLTSHDSQVETTSQVTACLTNVVGLHEDTLILTWNASERNYFQ